MLQRILLDLNTAVEQLEMLDKAVSLLTESLIAEIDDEEFEGPELSDIKVYLWVIASITNAACCVRDGIETLCIDLERKGKDALEDSNSNLWN